MLSETYLILRSAPQGRFSKDARSFFNRRSKFPFEP